MLTQEIKAITQEVVELRRDFHRHPELGWQEVRTSGIVERYLQDLGISTERICGTGIVGVIEGGKPGRTLLFRADMDALPIEEETGAAYASEQKGVMHACGHDAHTAMLLGAAKILSCHKEDLAGTIKLVFQPNEETGDGAASMVRAGVLENPKVDASFGLHVHGTMPVGKIGIAAGPALGEMYDFKIRLKGKGGHTSTPQNAVDPILCMAHIIEAAQMVQSREIDPMQATSLMFGKVSSGTLSNVIPETAEMEGSLRYLYDGSDSGEEQPRVRFRRIVEDVCRAHRIECDMEFIPSNYVVINDKGCVDYLKEKVFPYLSEKMEVDDAFVVMGGDDFSDFSNLNNIPGAYFFLGASNPEKDAVYIQHNAKFNIDEDILPIGVEIFVRTAIPDLD